jgi:hypothetical protein
MPFRPYALHKLLFAGCTKIQADAIMPYTHQSFILMRAGVLMRTTLNIDDEVFEQVRRYARARTIPAGEAVTRLLKDALNRPLGFRMEEGFAVFDVPEDSPIVTQAHVQSLIDDL